jgi:hypothetical protein
MGVRPYKNQFYQIRRRGWVVPPLVVMMIIDAMT